MGINHAFSLSTAEDKAELVFMLPKFPSILVLHSTLYVDGPLYRATGSWKTLSLLIYHRSIVPCKTETTIFSNNYMLSIITYYKTTV